VSQTAESVAKTVSKYSDTLILRVDRSISSTFKGINESILKPAQDKTGGKLAAIAVVSQIYSAAGSEIVKSYDSVLEYSNDKVDSWLPEAGDSKVVPKVTLGYVVAKAATRTQKRASSRIAKFPEDAREFASVTFVRIQKLPSEIGQTVSGYAIGTYHFAGTKVSDMKSWTIARQVEVREYVETTRFLLIKKFSEGYTATKSTIVISGNEDFMNRAGKFVAAMKGVEVFEVPRYAMKKVQTVVLRRKSPTEDAKFSDVEIQLLDLVYSLGGLFYLESLVRSQASA